MNLVRWNNQPRFSNIFDHVLFNDALTNDYHANYCKKPATNIEENENGFNIEMAIPGFSKAEVNISVDNQLLTVSSEKENNETEANVTLKEFDYHSFSRSFRLPKSIDVEKIKADYNNGILSIALPKKEEAKETLKREIKIS